MEKSTVLHILGALGSVIVIALGALEGELFLLWLGVGLFCVSWVITLVSWALSGGAEGIHPKEVIKHRARRARNKRLHRIVVISIIIGLVVVGVCGYFLLRNNREEADFIISIAIITICLSISEYIFFKIDPDRTAYTLSGLP